MQLERPSVTSYIVYAKRQTARQSPVWQFHRLLAAQSPVGMRNSRHPGNFLTEHWSSEGRLPLAREDGLTALCRSIPGCHQQQLTLEKLSNRALLAWVPSTSFCCRAGVRCVAALSGIPGAERRLEILVSWREDVGNFQAHLFWWINGWLAHYCLRNLNWGLTSQQLGLNTLSIQDRANNAVAATGVKFQMWP